MQIKCEIVHKCGLPNYSSVSVGLSVTKELDPEEDPCAAIQGTFRAVEAQIEKKMKEMNRKLNP